MSMYWIIFIGFALLSWLVSSRLQNKFEKYSKIPMPNGMTGKDVAEKMLHDNGIYDVKVISTPGHLTDHYNPANQTVNLSESVYYSNSIAAAAVAAHECGHAVQHATAYAPLRMRSALVPVVSFASNIMTWVLLGGMLLINSFPQLLLFGIILFASTTLFSFITLPVEINASQRALAWLSNAGITNVYTHDKAEDAFAQKDARLYGTVIYPGAKFKGKEVIFQAGRKYLENGAWKTETSTCGTTDEAGNTITALNGPVENSDNNINKSGFNIRKFLDETASAGTISRGSEVWYVQFRYAEILLTAAEAAMELNDPSALGYINQVRSRAGIQPLESVTLNDIIRERRVEFAFENQRYWDLKRWRIAHKLWDGDENNSDAVQYVLFPYVIPAKLCTQAMEIWM